MSGTVTARSFWNMRSAHYDEQVGGVYEEAYRRTVEKMLPYLSPDACVLDFACGTGIVTLPIAQRVREVEAIDISEEMIRRLEEKRLAQGVENVRAARRELFDPSLEEGSFDAVLACNVLLYVENRAQTLERIRALLKPEGVFLSVTDCLGEGWTRERVCKWWRSRTGQMPYVSFDTVARLSAEVAAAGFTLVESENLFPAPPNLFLAAKKES